MVSGGKTTLCDYSVLFSLVIYQGKTIRSEFEKESSNRIVNWDESEEWLRLSERCVWMQMHELVCVCIQSSPLFPLQPLLPPNSPLKQINCLRPPRQNGATIATTRNDNWMFCKLVLSPYNPLSPKAIPLASRASRYQHLPSGSIGWIKADRPADLYATSPSIVRRTAPTGWPSTAAASSLKRAAASSLSPPATISHGELTSFCGRFDMYKCCIDHSWKNAMN